MRPLLRLHGEEVLTLVNDLAARDFVVGVADEHLGKRGLAAPVLPHDGMHLALPDREIHALEDFLPRRGDLDGCSREWEAVLARRTARIQCEGMRGL